MSFELILNIPMDERVLLNLISLELMKKFLTYQGGFFFCKLKKCGNKKSKIIWIKMFNHLDELYDFYFATDKQRAAIFIHYNVSGHFSMDLHGFHYISNCRVYSNSIDNFKFFKLVFPFINSCLAC